MKKLIVVSIVCTVFNMSVQAKDVEQTICFSKVYSGNPSKYFPNGVPVAQLGDDIKLLGGICQARTLPQMNKNGWRLMQVVTGLQGAFGMVLSKVK